MWNLIGQVCHTCHMGLGNTHSMCVQKSIFQKIPSTYFDDSNPNRLPINLYRLATYK